MGFLLAFGNAFFESLRDAAAKMNGRRESATAVAWGGRLWVTLIALPLAWISNARWPTTLDFWGATSVTVSINIVTSILYVRALQRAPLSLALPMLQLSPVFLLITAPWITGELPTPLGIGGVISTAIGTYVLNLGERSRGLFAPWASLATHPGTRSMLIVAILWSVSAPFDKRAVLASSPMVFIAISSAAITLGLTGVLIVRRQIGNVARGPTIARLGSVGLPSALSSICQMRALLVLDVPTVIAIKRSSALFGALWGRWWFAEPVPPSRAIGLIIVLAGMIAILFSR
ncbi:MAG: EamA family transporter [Planctomycetes bacterium]|nr:EamA family transporter [Planctomycetota bacterium]